MDIELTRQQRKECADRIKQYFFEERDEELGDLAAGLVLDFMLEYLGPYVYNQALSNAKAWFEQKLEGLEIDFSLLTK